MGRVFVSGASGFIGSNLVQHLFRNGHSVVALVHNENLPQNSKVTIVKGSILDPDSYKEHLSGCSWVFHCAGYVSFKANDFQKAYAINVVGTQKLLGAALHSKVDTFVHLSACAVLGYGRSPTAILDESSNPVLNKRNVYAFTKKAAEDEVLKNARSGLRAVIANISTVYGPGDHHLNSGSAIRSIYQKKMRFIPSGGTSYITIDDLMDGLLLLAQKGTSGERYVLSSENLTYEMLVSRIAQALQVTFTRYRLPHQFYYLLFPAAKCLESIPPFKSERVQLLTTQIVRESFGYKYFSAKKAIHQLGWTPGKDLESAVKKAFIYYQNNSLL